MDRFLQFLTDYTMSLTYEKLPQSTVHQVKRHLIDVLGCGIGGYEMGPPQSARAHALEVTSRPGSTVLGTRHRSAPELAAFANGVMGRYLDFNDTSIAPKTGHTSDNIAGVLAAAEYSGADMRTTIAAIVIAYEVMDGLGASGLGNGLWDNGWDHVTGVAISSAAGASKALGLNREHTTNALSLAATSSIATNQTRVGALSMWKGCAAGNAARNGIFAALIAGRGLTGPAEAFEGPRGFINQIGADLKLPTLGGDGTPFAVESDKFKAYPCDYEAQCSITPAVQIHRMMQGRVEDIEKVDVETYIHALEVAADTPDKWNPTSRETADHSIPYAVAVGLTRGTLWFDDFTPERITDPKIHALMQKIKVRPNDECTRIWPEAYPFRITATMKSGQKHFSEVKYAKGHPKNPMSDPELEAKFRKLCEPLMEPDQVTRALKRLWQLEKLKGARQVLDLFALESAR
ncbi:MAG: MmgE/PrpD family protein [Betaproteobacteria bacterium]|nr:MmgE/PrpD family protein [Betaproteobacteria bacterium]